MHPTHYTEEHVQSDEEYMQMLLENAYKQAYLQIRNERYYVRNKERICDWNKSRRENKADHIKAQKLEHYNKNKPEINSRRRDIYHHNKLVCLRHYTGINIPVCMYGGCLETDIDVLTIDHINNNGATHRKTTKYHNIYDQLRYEGFPPGFQVLCFNHNLKKGKLYKALSPTSRKDYVKLKMECLTWYSDNKLMCMHEGCSIIDTDMLTIDHINGGGRAHRRVIGSNNICGHLKKSGFPVGYQVLCMNHNHKKEVLRRRGNGSPH